MLSWGFLAAILAAAFAVPSLASTEAGSYRVAKILFTVFILFYAIGLLFYPSAWGKPKSGVQGK